ncbi:hypothetical protein [Inquilinus sp. CAU 1745]|uniref:hypothetical protein n=1 Tax=Inquilinus sp. CAU 1745 TaxID=3140369 RepID=UPI00325B1B7B
MRTSPSAWNHHQANNPVWQPWTGDALVAGARGGPVGVEPAPWLTPHQARRLHDLLDDLLTYQSVNRLGSRIPGGDRALKSQAREIDARLVELAAAGVTMFWRPGA